MRTLKGQCHEIVDLFLLNRDSTWAPYEHAKMVSRKTCVCVVNDYANTMSVWSTTTLTLCQRSQRLCGHIFIMNIFAKTIIFADVRIVVDYTDTVSA